MRSQFKLGQLIGAILVIAALAVLVATWALKAAEPVSLSAESIAQLIVEHRYAPSDQVFIVAMVEPDLAVYTPLWAELEPASIWKRNLRGEAISASRDEYNDLLTSRNGLLCLFSIQQATSNHDTWVHVFALQPKSTTPGFESPADVSRWHLKFDETKWVVADIEEVLHEP